MHLFKTILSSFQDPKALIDFKAYDLSKLSPVSTPNVSSAQPGKFAMASNDVIKFLTDAPEVITRNIAYWYQHNLQTGSMIPLSIFQAIDKLAKASDTELSMIFLSLLVHASKYKLNIFKIFVENIASGLCRRASGQEAPSEHVVDGALSILKSDPFVNVSTDILNGDLENESQVTTAFTREQIEQCNIHFIYMVNPIVKGWATADGVAINVAALPASLVETKVHRVALASLLGHEIQHYLSRYAFDNMNLSTPELLSRRAIKANSNSPSAQKLKSKFPNFLDSGLIFEYAAFGAKFNFQTGSSRPLLNVLEQRLSNMPVCLPLIGENEKGEDFVKPFLNPSLNVPFGFELSGDEDFVFE